MGKIVLPQVNMSDAAKDVTPATQQGINNQQQARPRKMLQVQIDEDLHAQFKAAVGLRKSNMTDVVERLIRSYLQEQQQ